MRALLLTFAIGALAATSTPTVSMAIRPTDPLLFHVTKVQEVHGAYSWSVMVTPAVEGSVSELRFQDATKVMAAQGSELPLHVVPDQTFEITVHGEPNGICTVQYEFDGVTRSTSFSLPVTMPTPGRLVFVTHGSKGSPAPGSDNGYGPPDTQQEEKNLKIGGLGKKTPRDITVHGRIVFTRPARNGFDAATIGAPLVPIEVYDEDFLGDDLEGATTTDWDGNYSVTFHWAPCWACETNPDIYIVTYSSNSHISVGEKFFGIRYSWHSSTHDNFSGTDLDLGDLHPDSDAPSLGILTNVSKAWRWSNDYGFNVPFVSAKWPSNDVLITHYTASTQTLHIQSDDEWIEYNQVHEYGHHWTNTLATFEVPTYLDPHCGLFGHCAWCSENETAAYEEGFAEWFCDAVVKTFDPPSTTRDPDVSTDVVDVCDEDNALNDPWTTEGFVAALMRDIEDGGVDNEEDPAFPGDGLQDVLSLGPEPILTVAHLDAPTTTSGFINAFIARYPSLACDFWETARNNGFNTPPGAVTGLIAGPPPGPTACAPPNHALEFSWTLPTENWSCVNAYSVLVSSTAQMPDAIAELGDVTSYTTACLGAGKYVFNIRARDRSGLWSNQFASYPFEFYGIPTTPPPSADTPAITTLEVKGNRPNPFTGQTELEIGLPQASAVAIDVFDVLGRRVSSMSRSLAAGWQRVVLLDTDEIGRTLPSGVYFYRVRASGFDVIRKMIITH